MKNIDIEKLKASLDILTVVKNEGFDLQKNGNGWKLLCPFHDDKNPSLSIDDKKQLFHCFGCGKSGDVIKFVEYLHNYNFKQAVEHLSNKYLHTHYFQMNKPAVSSKPTIQPADDINLNELAEKYHQALLQKKPALDYLAKRGITSLDLIKKFKVGYVNGYVTFPFFDENNNVGEIYSRAISDDAKLKHKYLPGPHKGIFNLDAVKNSSEIYLCECVIDALSLFQMGIENVTCTFGKGNLTDEIINTLAEYIKRVFIVYDNDGDNDQSAEKTADILTSKGLVVERLILPKEIKDVNDYFVEAVKAGLPLTEIKEKFLHLQSIPYEKTTDTQDDRLQLQSDEHNILIFTINGKTYKVKGLRRQALADLRALIRCEYDNKVTLQNVDLLSSRSRENFSRMAKDRLGVSEFEVQAELETMMIFLEELQESEYLNSLDTTDEEFIKPPYEITEERIQKARERLQEKDYLTETLIQGMEAMSVVGEEHAKILYTIAILSSQLTSKPIHILMVSRSGVGKSHIQKWIITFFPDEDVFRISGTSPKVLYYLERDTLKNKALSIDEDVGMENSKYSIRTMMSEGRLELWVTEKDSQGKNRASCRKVDGPCSILVSSTSLYSFDSETRSRMINIFGDESPEQTGKIQDALAEMAYTDDGDDKAKRIPEIQQSHQDMIYVLREAVNIKVRFKSKEQLKKVRLTDNNIRTRRNCTIYLTVVEVIAKTRFLRKQIHEKNGERIIYVDDEDISLAKSLMETVFMNQSADLKGAVLRFYAKIIEFVDKNRGNVPRNEYEFKGRDMRLYAQLSKTEANDNFKELVELEYIRRVRAKKGSDNVYQLCDNETIFDKNNE